MKVKEFYSNIKQTYLNGKHCVLTNSDVKAVFDFFYGRDFAAQENEVDKKTAAKINKIINRRIKTSEPIYSIIGYAPFYGRFFKTKRNVLKPRLDTEVALAEALKVVNKNSRVLDLCTGTGILGLTINLETGANVVCADISPVAVRLAKQNAKLLGAQAKIIKSDMFSATQGKFDVIVSNPPYIASANINNLEDEVKKFDPRLALDGGNDGMKFYNIIRREFLNYLNPNGVLILEMSSQLATSIETLFKPYETKIVKDFEGRNRVAVIKIKE